MVAQKLRLAQRGGRVHVRQARAERLAHSRLVDARSHVKEAERTVVLDRPARDGLQLENRSADGRGVKVTHLHVRVHVAGQAAAL